MTWVFVGIVVVLLLVIGLLFSRQQRSRQLQKDFGPEYRRAVTQHGDQRSAEKDLRDRRRRVEKFEIRPLNPASRERYTERWGAIQRDFVDEPMAAVNEAHALVEEVMGERGYPVAADFEQRAADISVDHADVVENYRAAHHSVLEARNGHGNTEQLRRSMVHFRVLFEDLLTPGEDQPTDALRSPGEPEEADREVEQGTVADHTIRRG